jgi:superfamily I DNA and RNA helicase
MSLEVVRGASRNRLAAEALAAKLRSIVSDGTVYLAYPVLATADERVEVDALLVSRDHGLVAFLLPDTVPSEAGDWDRLVSDQDRLYAVIEGHLRRHEALRSGRRLALTPSTATIFPDPVPGIPGVPDGFYGTFQDIPAFLGGLEPITPEVERAVQAALQRVSTIKPVKKRAGVQAGTRGAILKEIERNIANLDRWQKAAAIESPEGPQRIRGLAGSGKTIVLALKAAYWHSQNPEWQIVVTFHSRALYQQMADLTTRFTFEHANDSPDPEFLRIIHSWGSGSRPGVYSLMAAALHETPRDYAYARGKYGIDDAFQGICQELLEIARVRPPEPIFDAVLIDEAQDLPPEFFQLVYLFTRAPKRIVWAYDEMQKLSESTMPDTDELFGTGQRGESLVNLESSPDGPRRDIVLPVCYRNTPWALATAHALGLGIYRDGGLLQHPDEPNLWTDIGYRAVHGRLALGAEVTLERDPESAPPYFGQLLRPEDSVVVKAFPDERAQDVWVADQIYMNLTEDELEHDDILIVLPDTYRAKSRGPRLMRELARREIVSHLAGVNTSRDTVFQGDSVAITHIHRAKGNEAPMVYAIDSQYASLTFNEITRRNTLFTAITRNRAWVRIVGWGSGMTSIGAEAATVAENSFQLRFAIPDPGKLAKMRHVYRVRPAAEEETVRKATAGLETFLEAFERGEVDLHDLPPALRTRLIARIQREEPVDDE